MGGFGDIMQAYAGTVGTERSGIELTEEQKAALQAAGLDF